MPRHPDTSRYVYPGSLADAFWKSWPGEGRPVWDRLNEKVVALCDMTDWPEEREWPEELGFAFKAYHDSDHVEDLLWLVDPLLEQLAPLDAWWVPDEQERAPDEMIIRRVEFDAMDDNTIRTFENDRRIERHPWLPSGGPTLDDRDWLVNG